MEAQAQARAETGARIGLMTGPEPAPPARRIQRLRDHAEAAERAGFQALWVAQRPGDFDALTAIVLMAGATRHIELGTAVLPIQPRHPLALAQQALSTQSVCGGRFTLGIGPSHHWIVRDQLGLPYERPARAVRHYVEVLEAALAGADAVVVENEDFRVHSPLDFPEIPPTPLLLAALGPAMLRLAGERSAGTILWMADERAIGEHVVPRIAKAAAEAGRPAPRIVAGVPVCLCARGEVDEARHWANRRLGHAEYSPNYQRLLERGDAQDVGDLLAAGDDEQVVARLRAFRDAGATDLAIRVLPLGRDREARAASHRRTEDLLASLCPAI